jgi:hypothetical protein
MDGLTLPRRAQASKIRRPKQAEPDLEHAYANQRGWVQEFGGAFLHFYEESGAIFGYGVKLRGIRLGTWHCAKPRPRAELPRTKRWARQRPAQ